MEALVATPAAFRATGKPTFTPSTTNCTKSVGVTPVLDAFVTVAVNVTDCPKVDAFSEEVTAVEVLARFTVSPPGTVPVLVLKLLSPP
jgi:hypothetical protein